MISKNHFLISEIHFLISENISWYKKTIIFWYQKIIFWYQKIIFWYKKIQNKFPFARYFRVPIYSAGVWGKYIMLPWFHVLAQGLLFTNWLRLSVAKSSESSRFASSSAESLPRHLNHVVCHSNDELELGANRGEGEFCICVYLSQALAECIGTLWKAKWEFIQCFFISKNSVRSGNLFCIFWYQKIILIFWYQKISKNEFLISENDFLI